MTSTTRCLSYGLGAALAVVTCVPAQSPAPGHLVGWGWNNGPLTVCSSLYTQDLEGGCQKAVNRGSSICSQRGLGGGGTAYDPRVQAAWVTNGAEMALQEVATGKVLCRIPATVTNPYVISGLALADSRRELFKLEIGPQLLVISSYDVTVPCKPVHNKNWCRIKNTGTGATGQGLAYDESRDLLYYVSSLAGLISWINTVHVVARANPCVDLATFPVNFCGGRPGGPVTGLGYDACSTRLYATDGGGTRVLLLTDPVKGQVTDLTGSGPCCKFAGTGVWMGLDVVPDWQATSHGGSCVQSACGACSAMDLMLIGGDASLGNPDFGFHLRNAPRSAQGLFYVAIGNCTVGTPIPGLCGMVHTSLVAPFPLLGGSFQTGGSAACGGEVRLVTGIPADPVLCKTRLCTQFFVLCAGGHGLSNAVGFSVGG